MDTEVEKDEVRAGELREMLSGLVAYMARFESGVRRTVGLYQGGEVEQAHRNTIEILDGLGWIMEGVDVCKELLDINVTDLVQTLEQLQSSLENGDNVTTSDLFEHELLPTVARWKQRMMDVDGGIA
ncbi:MAG: hypothetical protein JXX29_16570 [Deltaproteobacteria bacterium]|nr:hypothetical protein [Deltaproteobacteria bacterium]MBN2673299.1 hypothetical protein [Deltaproteobacteria bacterium]